MKRLYTIGHSNYNIDRFINILNTYNINVVVDIRGTPYSKYNTQYNKESLKSTLNKLGYIYIYMGKEFAAQRDNKIIYTWEGYADFDKIIYEEDFIQGIERLKVGLAKNYNIVLLGAKQNPVYCHRFALVGRELNNRGFNIMHIEDDLSLSTQDEVEERLLDKYFPNVEQLTFEVMSSNGRSREDKLRESYMKINREIGLRVENIKVTKKNQNS